MSIKTVVFLFIYVFCLFPIFAIAGEDLGLGRVATNLLQPVTVMSDFVITGSLIIGTVFLLASIIRFVEHRRNPLMVPISTVIFLLIAGQVLILLPVLSMFSEGGIPYTFFK